MQLPKNVVRIMIWMATILVSLWLIASSEVGNIPSGALLAVCAILGWWLVGGVNKEGQHNR